MLPIKQTLVQNPPPGVAKRAWREILREGHADQASYWHSTLLPRHFAPGAAGRYGYARRSRKFLDRKARLKAAGKIAGGANEPLVYHGLLQSAATGYAAIRAFPTRARADLTVPVYARIRYQAGRPNLGLELLTITDEEHRRLGRRLERFTGDKLNKLSK